MVSEPRQPPAGLAVAAPLAAGAEGGGAGGAAKPAPDVGSVVDEGEAVQDPSHRDVCTGGGDEEGHLRVPSAAAGAAAVVPAVAVVAAVVVDGVVGGEGERGQERRCSRSETRGRRADVEGVCL